MGKEGNLRDEKPFGDLPESIYAGREAGQRSLQKERGGVLT
jgi:hypothetical protein